MIIDKKSPTANKEKSINDWRQHDMNARINYFFRLTNYKLSITNDK
ncbi:hypothetical protein [Microcoleus vaginatus]